MPLRLDASALASPDTLESLGAGRAVVLDGLLGVDTAMAARNAALAMDGEARLRPAGIGRDATAAPSIRGDRIAWLEAGTSAPAFAPILELLDATRIALNELVFLGADELECQVALYEAGSGYDRHRDALRASASRRVTAIYYLNDWQPGDGGELEVFDAGPLPTQVIEPLADRLVLFRSLLTEHAVREVRRGPRIAVSAFLRRQHAL